MKKFLFILGATLLLAGCSMGEQTLCGTYHGVLPAASGPGIETDITFNKNGTFSRHQVYLDEKDGVFDESGTYKIRNNIITLSSGNGESSYYQIEDRQIRQLDMEKKPVTGDLAQYYVLKQSQSCAN